MIVYLAGAYSRPNMLEQMNVYLAGNSTNQQMDVYIAGEEQVKNGKTALSEGVMILESYVYARKNKHLSRLLPTFKKFILDSGAFTFMVQAKKNRVSLDWDRYISEYAEFINHFKVDHFFELDIDKIVGMKEVERLRTKLEHLTGKPSIPVWHKSRGVDYWHSMIKNYGYISLSASGKNYSSEWVRTSEGVKAMRMLVDAANDKGVKVHGLGYTKVPVLRYVKFHSVDSSSWLMGNRGGYLFFFTGNSIVQRPKPKGTRMVPKETAKHNFLEWVKFQQYAEANL